MLARVVLTGIAVCGIAGLSACNTYPPPPPEAPAVPSAGPPAPYRIQAGDVLGIQLLLNPDLDEDVVVRPDGHISTTVVKDASASGRTVPELTAVLTHDYEPIIRNRHLSVVLRTFSPVRIYVGGMVNKPGESVTVGLSPTLSQAILRAGGLKTERANRVFVIRRGPDEVPQFFSVPLRDVMQTHDPKADVRVEPYDVVYVSRDGADEAHRFLDQCFALLAPPMWGFTYTINVAPTTDADAARPEPCGLIGALDTHSGKS
ncbi:MAG TPA: polysaccharide biosynthesis/export family protein [Acetobacteraceae bacterium]|nr:polysaccharide biosynthesis/export family protein [Acetobacteraceae bacterium]